MIVFYLSADDLSFKKVASQSTTWFISKYYASNAVDRNTETCMRTYDIGGLSMYKTVWWKVDLGGEYTIYSINILFKNYAGNGKYSCVQIIIDTEKK